MTDVIKQGNRWNGIIPIINISKVNVRAIIPISAASATHANIRTCFNKSE